ncbi:TetR family transcriptional regulator [Nonomuraea sp. WAC 01424]|uniref:TetR/AcrR family transcriptional regulator n=1 Tax=Nonomuraea sp. WAC 01424 TaxID=2203200 RepID=UPI000F7B9653|nr:TetR/AcrR family transcriptional regulator C-terminal domain-containing protein [Nonomuraea sp. WAC 01424]RSN15500.1 TetR family transcriptional regulator [Nonomuraea sp. WAC 01424]
MPANTKPIASVWTRSRPPQREQLTREQIVAAAIELLDAEGVEALSMRKLGARLGAGATSLYRHVTNRDELIQLAVDDVCGELDLPAPADPAQWRAAVAHTATEVRAMVLRHPWVALELGQIGLIHIGPNAMRMSSELLAWFEAAGFPAREKQPAAGTLMSYVIGIATAEAAYISLIARSGSTESAWVASRSQDFDEGADPRQLREDHFAYGLDRVLDGLAARLDGRGSGRLQP